MSNGLGEEDDGLDYGYKEDERVQDLLKADKDIDRVFLEMVNRLNYYMKRSEDLEHSIAKLEH